MENSAQTQTLPAVVAVSLDAAAEPLTRRPYCRRSETAWAAIRQLYEAGATAKSLTQRYGGTERTIFTRARKDGWLRKDQSEAEAPLTSDAAETAALRLAAGEADRRVLELPEDAGIGEAARAAMLTSIEHVKRADPGRAYTWARLAGTLERLARAPTGAVGSGLGEDPTEPGRRAALDFLRREGVDLKTLEDEG